MEIATMYEVRPSVATSSWFLLGNGQLAWPRATIKLVKEINHFLGGVLIIYVRLGKKH